MSTPSDRLGLALPALSDRFSTAEIKANWEKIDAAPGLHICTSTTRPTGWTQKMAGRKIIETNTGIEYMWTGTAWSRSSGSAGILRLSGGNVAVAQRPNNFQTSSTTHVKIIALEGVVVPAGNRPLMIVATWYQADNTAGPFSAALYRSSVANSGPIITKATVGTAGNRGPGGQMIGFEKAGLPAGTYDFSLQIRSFTEVGGVSYMYGDNVQPIQIMVTEL